MNRQAEPEQLRRGRVFHKLVQTEWENDAEGCVVRERQVLLNTSRKGRVDVFVDDGQADGCIAIIEVKASDWDRMSGRAVERNVRRQIRQVLRYISSQLDGGNYVSTGEHKTVSPGIIFAKSPNDQERKRRIEGLFIDDVSFPVK